MSTAYNPYQAPTAIVDDVPEPADAQAETIRREHIKHEASIRSVGALYYVSVLAMVITGISSAFIVPAAAGDRIEGIVMGAVLLAFAVGMFVVGRGLRKLKPWVKIPTIGFSVIGLLGFPVGTLLNGYILWLIASKKGSYILSPEYASIVAATPQVKYRTSILIWILLGIIVLGIAAAIIIPLFGKIR
ncbi:MAG: hypothetical protein ABI905_05935 [Betaproteobacteria bacterium]